MIREVLQLGNPLLREKCAPVEDSRSAETARIAADLRDTVRHWRNETGYGRAIAAPQIGVMKRVVYLDRPREIVLVNPEIIDRSPETMIVWDACLSFLSLFMQVERRRWIRVRYSDLDGNLHELCAGTEDDLGELLQHEIDHLDGILALDRMRDARTLTSREEFEKRYREGSPYAAAPN